MNLFEKLNAARLYFQNSNVKKSGKNTYAGYTYYELSDILPVINKAAQEIGFCCVVSFGQDEATLSFIDNAKPDDRIVFSSPMSTAAQKGCQEVQNLGAVETYIRRYLYLCAFEIVESDALDAAMNPNGNSKKTPQPAFRETTTAPTAPTAPSAPSAPSASSASTAPSAPSDKGAEMAKILSSVYPNGELIFSETEKNDFRTMWTKRSADASLDAVKKALAEKLEAFKRGAA